MSGALDRMSALTPAQTTALSVGTRGRRSRRSSGGLGGSDRGACGRLRRLYRNYPRGSNRQSQTTFSPHSPAYYAVGGGACCPQRLGIRLVPGPTTSYEPYGLTRNAQVRSSNLLPGSKKRCNCKGFEKVDARSRCGRATYGPQTGSLSNTRDCRRRSVRTAPGVPAGDRLWAVPASIWRPIQGSRYQGSHRVGVLRTTSRRWYRMLRAEARATMSGGWHLAVD